MKSTTVALGLLAGVASASYNHPRHFHAPRPYYRRDNGTEPTQTTLTVQVTQVHTLTGQVTSCAPTVTDCPARLANGTAAATGDLTTDVVTQVVDLTTTICPVTAAESVSSAIVAQHSSGLITGTTHDVTATASSGNSGVTVSPSVGTTDVPITYTVGPESSRSVITTTIHSTYTQQVTVTKTKSGSTSESDSPAGSEGAGASSEGTTTTTSTSTGTRTVTISKASTATATASATGYSTSENSATGSSGDSSDSDSGSCPEAVTVTVTVPASTVYITQTAASGSASAAATGTSSSDNSATGSDSGADDSDDSDDSGDSDECDASETDAGVVTATQVATVVPYPVGSQNGTYPTPTAAPTGLFRARA
ncbi:hypothetical protein SCUP234_00808 [Seiridium cupressi]